MLALLLTPMLAACGPRHVPVASVDVTPAARSAQATLEEWQLVIQPLPTQTGSMQFIVRNQGTTTHAFTLEGMGQRIETQRLEPGQQAAFEMNLRGPGTYIAVCPIGDHRNRGMNATFSVQ